MPVIVSSVYANPKMSLSSDGKTLTIKNVCKTCNPSDLMALQCNASNAYGYAFGAGYLNVLGECPVCRMIIPRENTREIPVERAMGNPWGSYITHMQSKGNSWGAEITHEPMASRGNVWGQKCFTD